ncbi:MAG: (4Fe-4S)-binding protein [Candidatus Abyssobacteria bacterium SURF_5]|uniref:(4Fe-4S)-binding protein n=1 Tax=Abyssobacteria bacterium (strain SURF_5) TaxID=2093360 RepID=A0A3A4NNL3_ABYX5|nr:MAG: (4Fe-4S)-binding protein [Candidatus Abyssubacteria bacterium SURF_5]
MSKHEVYDQLAEHLNSMPIGAPKTPELIEILKILYTKEEADLAVKLPFLPMTVDALVDRTGMAEKMLKPMLDRMAKKGIVFEQLGGDEPMYRLLPTVVGFSETPFWPGKRTPETEKLAVLWRKYARDAFFHEIGGLSETPLVRVIPVQESLSETRKVSPYEKLVEKVKETSYQAVAHCPCRLMREYSGDGKCEHSTENCLHFGSLARYMVANGMARELTVDETLAILKKSNEEGLVHVTGNHQAEIDTICNCCADACIFLTGLLAMGEKNMFARSNFVSQINQETCVECGTCEERCPVKAISLSDGPARVDEDKCIGCGVCFPTCPSESISLAPRPETEQLPVLPPGEMVMKVMAEKGRAFKF